MCTNAFLNIPVADVARSRRFFAALGWRIEETFEATESATVVVNDNFYLMLLARSCFESYVTTAVVDATRQTEVMICLSADDREGVDEVVDRALRAGGRIAGEPRDLGYVYNRSFRDLDGHIFEMYRMDQSLTHR